MQPIPKNPLLLAVLAALVALLVWPGCATVPVPADRTPISGRKSQDFGFIRVQKTTRSDVVAKRGNPDLDFPEFRVVCYQIARIQRKGVFVVGGVPIGGSDPRGRAELELAFIQFDEQDRVKRSTVLTTPKSPREAVVDWQTGRSR